MEKKGSNQYGRDQEIRSIKSKTDSNFLLKSSELSPLSEKGDTEKNIKKAKRPKKVTLPFLAKKYKRKQENVQTKKLKRCSKNRKRIPRSQYTQQVH